MIGLVAECQAEEKSKEGSRGRDPRGLRGAPDHHDHDNHGITSWDQDHHVKGEILMACAARLISDQHRQTLGSANHY